MQDGARCAQKSKKCEKSCEKVAQDPPKRSVLKTSAGRAMPCLKSDRTKIGPLTLNIQPRWGGTPAHCIRFAHPAEALRKKNSVVLSFFGVLALRGGARLFL